MRAVRKSVDICPDVSAGPPLRLADAESLSLPSPAHLLQARLAGALAEFEPAAGLPEPYVAKLPGAARLAILSALTIGSWTMMVTAARLLI